MSHPFLIWTMQRTGGTALTNLLMQMSEHRAAEHEPFNWARKKPRQFWPIAEAWNESKDPDALQRSLAGLFADRFLIKHCYELLAMPFNLHLLQAASATGYRHVHLLRRDEPARLVSKFIAESQGTWFKDYSNKVFAEVVGGQRGLGPLPTRRIVEHYEHCRDATGTIADGLQRTGVDRMLIHYEELYVGARAPRLARMHALLGFLGFTAAEIERQRGRIEQTLFDAGQNTSAVAPFVPNLDEVMGALQQAGCPLVIASADACANRLADDTPPPGSAEPAPNEPTPAEAAPLRGPARIAAEFARIAQDYRASGPYLELGVGLSGTTVLDSACFSDAARHAVSDEPASAAHGVTYHQGSLNDLRPLFGDGHFGTVLWNGAIAHDRFFWRTLDEMRRVLAPGGLMILVAPGFSKAADRAGIKVSGAKGNAIPDSTVTYRIHTARDYWRISPQAMRQVILADLEVLEVKTAMMPPRIFAVARKPDVERP